VLNLLRIEEKPTPPEPGSDPQLSLFGETPGTAEEAIPHLLPDLDEPRHARILRRTFIASLALHVALILLLVLNPDLINLGSPRIVPIPPEEKQVTMLLEPPPERPRLQEPPMPKTLPRAEGARDSNLEKLAPPPPTRAIEPQQPPSPPPGPPNREQPAPRQMEPIGIPKFPEVAKVPPKQEPSLENLPKPKEQPSAEAQLRLPELAPASRGTDAILRDLAKQHAEGGGNGLGGGVTVNPDPNNPNFNLPGPQILSDTMGVDFDPYLLRVYLIVRRNWDSVIPEIARLGRKGRVVLQFNIRKNGTVVDLNLMSGSGTGSMDAAALSSIQLSNPFPPLPPEFPGNDILLRFGYYYNMEPEY
jgi:TonB family protein